MERNRKADQNPRRVVAPIEEEEKQQYEFICWYLFYISSILCKILKCMDIRLHSYIYLYFERKIHSDNFIFLWENRVQSFQVHPEICGV